MNTETTQTTEITTQPHNQGTPTPAATPITPIPGTPSAPKPDALPKSRRIRRSSRPTGTPRSRCSRTPRASNPKSKTQIQKPFEPLPEFANLTPEHREAIHDYIRHHTYEESIAFLRKELGVEISLNRLYRYRSRLDLATQLEIADDNAPAIEKLLALLAGKPVDIDAAGLHVIKQRALAIAARPDAAASVLMNLFRIFTWEHRKMVAEHRMRSIDRREKCRERVTKVAERRQNLAEKKFKNQTGNRKRTIEEQSARVIELFGDLPPVRPLDAPPKPVDI